MQTLQNGQCGLCSHFGENDAKQDVLVTIRTNKTADALMMEPCGLSKNAAVHLKVTPFSGCDGFQPAAAA